MNLAFLLSIFLSPPPLDRWKMYKSFFENAPYPLTVVEENGVISYANKEFAKLVGFKMHEILGEHFTKFVAPEDRERLEKYHAKRIKGMHAPSEYEYRATTKDGKIKYVRIKVIKLDENRTISCKIDLTKEKEIESLFKKMAQSSVFAFFIYQNDYFVYINDVAEKITGYKREDLLNMRFWELVEKNHRKIVKERGRKRQKGESVAPEMYEIPFYTKDGKIKWGLFSFMNISYQGEPAGAAVAIDITEIKEARETFEAIFNNAKDGIFIISKEGNIIDVNEAGARMLGYEREELKGVSSSHIISGSLKKDWENVLKARKSIMMETENIKKDGSLLPVEISINFVSGKGEEYIVKIVRDISRRRSIEKELKESEERYRMLVELSQEGISICDEDGNITFVNDAFAKMLGYEKKELLKKKIAAFIKEKKRIGKNRYEAKFVTKDGKIKTIIISSTPVYKNGKYEGEMSVNLDISERKAAEEKLAESEALFRAITQSSMVGIFIVQDGKIKFMNPAFLKIIDYGKKEIEKMDYLGFVYPEDKEKVEDEMKKVEEGSKINIGEFRYVTRDGKIKWGNMAIVPIEYKGKKATLATLMDLTEIRKTYEIRRKFIEETSHHFFNPIAIAKGYLELAIERNENVETLKKVNNAIGRIEKVIWNIVERGEICE